MKVYENIDFYDFWTSDIKKYPIPTTEENNELAMRAKMGEEGAYEELLNRNKRLILRFASKFTSSRDTLEELFQEGSIALYDALSTYDETRGNFISYAVMFIKKYMNRAMARSFYGYQLTPKFYHDLYTYRDIDYKCQMMGVELPNDEELKKELKVGQETLERLKNADTLDVWSLNHVYSNSNNDDFLFEDYYQDKSYLYGLNIRKDDNGNFLVDYDNSILEEPEIIDVDSLLKILKYKLSDYYYFLLYFSVFAKDSISYKGLADIFGLTREATRRIVKKTLVNVENIITHIDLQRYVSQHDLSNIKIRPLIPDDILKYFFVRDQLNPVERALYKEKVFAHFKISKALLAERLEIDLAEFDDVWSNTCDKVKMYLESNDGQEYKIFRSAMLKSYRNDIYNLDPDCEIVVDPCSKAKNKEAS